MELTIEQALQQSVAAHKEGRLQEAERLYSAILQADPAHPDANHNLGVLAVGVGKVDSALPYFKVALEANPKIAQFWLSYIDALIRAQQLDSAKIVLKESKKSGIVGEQIEALEAWLNQITQAAQAKLSDEEKTLSFKQKRDKIAASKQEKRRKRIDANTAVPSQQQLNSLLEHYQAGKYKEAEKLAVSITRLFPEHPLSWIVLGATFGKAGKKSEALSASQRAVDLAPQDAAACSNLGVALQDLGQLKEAEASYRRAIALKPNIPEVHNNLGNTLQELCRLEEAEASYRQAIDLDPDYVDAHYNLGIILQDVGRLEAAEASYRQAIALDPRRAETHNNLGIALRELGRLKAAEASYRQSIAIKPDYSEAHNNLSIILKELGRFSESIESCKQAIALKYDYPAAHNNLGIALKELGQLEDAEACCRQAIALKPDYVEAHYNLGIALNELGRTYEAEESYRQAIALCPDYAEAHYNLGNILRERNKFNDADECNASLECYKTAISLKPEYSEAYCNLGITLTELARFDEAETNYKRAVTLRPDFTEAHRYLALLKNYTEKDEQFLQMQALSLDERCSKEQHCDINFALAKACEDLGDFEKAFNYYNEGNALRKDLLNYDISQDIELFKQLRACYPKIAKDRILAKNLSSKPIPIFIVGMPRSGTTLVEQIISSHSQVTGAGELDCAARFGDSIARGLSKIAPDVLLNFRENYLRKLQDLYRGSLLVTDKMPQNFRYIGLLSAAFPEAKIVHVRRCPQAVCWGNYKQLFASKALGYCYDLNDIVVYYRLYESLMNFWELQLPNRIYHLDYELLTVNQEDETRKLIQHLGLSWENECLSPQNNRRSVATASKTQIREKIYQGSSQKWRIFEPFLGGVLDKLED